MKQEFNQELRDKMLEFVNFILGACIKDIEIHWTTNNAQTHQESDSLKWNLLDFADYLTEQFIGAVGRGAIGSGDINATILAVSNWDELTDAIKERCVEMKDYMSQQKTIYSGITSRIESFIASVLVNIYREELE